MPAQLVLLVHVCTFACLSVYSIYVKKKKYTVVATQASVHLLPHPFAFTAFGILAAAAPAKVWKLLRLVFI